MFTVNKVILIGYVADAAKYIIHNGGSICNFQIVTSKKWSTPRGEIKEKTEFHNIVTFRKVADLCDKIVTKGSLFYIEGELQTQTWGDIRGKQYKTVVCASKVILLKKKNDATQTDDTNYTNNEENSLGNDLEENGQDVPF